MMNRPRRVTAQLQVQSEHFSREQELSFVYFAAEKLHLVVEPFTSGRTSLRGSSERVCCCHYLKLYQRSSCFFFYNALVLPQRTSSI